MHTLWLECMLACMQSIHSDFESWPAEENDIVTFNFDMATLKPKMRRANQCDHLYVRKKIRSKRRKCCLCHKRPPLPPILQCWRKSYSPSEVYSNIGWWGSGGVSKNKTAECTRHTFTTISFPVYGTRAAVLYAWKILVWEDTSMPIRASLQGRSCDFIFLRGLPFYGSDLI